MSVLPSQRSKDVICGYFHSSHYHVPSEIIDVCTAFSNVGEEFDAQRSSMPIGGGTNTICKLPYGNHDLRLDCVGRNIVSSSRYTYYHWRLKVYGACNIGVSNSQKYYSFRRAGLDHLIFDFYVNFKIDVVSIRSQDRSLNNYKHYARLSSFEGYRLKITPYKRQNDTYSGILCEILSFHAANSNDTPLKLALSVSDHSDSGDNEMSLDQKISRFEAAIQADMRSFTYCDEYIACLMSKGYYDKAYEFVLEYNQRKNIPISYIADIGYHYYQQQKPETIAKSKQMFDLIDDESLVKDMDSMIIKGEVCSALKDWDNAIKYFDMCLENTDDTDAIAFCLCKKADVLFEMGEDTCDVMKLINEAMKYQPNESNDADEHENYPYICIANLLYAMEKYDESIPHFEKSMKHPGVGPECLENYANVLHLRQKYQKSNDLLYQLIGRNDYKKSRTRRRRL